MIATAILVLLAFARVVIAMVKHGETKEETYNAWYSILGFAVLMFFYWRAGLFDKFLIN